MSKSIFQHIPDAIRLIAMEPEELACYILEHLHSIEGNRANRFHPGNLAGEISRHYPSQYQQKVANSVRQACQLLKNTGFIYDRNEQGFFDFTNKGERYQTADDLLGVKGTGGLVTSPGNVNIMRGINITNEQNRTPVIDVFISHSNKDKDVAAALIDLLRAALNIPSEKIRCTSVDGYKLRAGASTDEQLRQEIYEARTFIGLITPTSLQSTYVLFELGARWGAGHHLAPVLSSGTDASALRQPLASLNALSCDVPAQVYQLVNDIAFTLEMKADNPSAYQKHVEALIEQSRESREQYQRENKAVLGEDAVVLTSKEHSGKSVDRRLYDELRQALPSQGVIAFLRDFNMAGGAFDLHRFDPLYSFIFNWNDVEHEFLDKELEEKRSRLYTLIEEYTGLLAYNTFPTKSGLQTVPPEWEEEQPERFQRVVSQLHSKAEEIVKTHQDLIRTARHKLEY